MNVYLCLIVFLITSISIILNVIVININIKLAKRINEYKSQINRYTAYAMEENEIREKYKKNNINDVNSTLNQLFNNESKHSTSETK